MSRLEDCCRSCPCGQVVCNRGTNACSHGLATCEDCAPGECIECATEMAGDLRRTA